VTVVAETCRCDDPDTLGTDDGSGTTTCLYFALGYPWCRSCREHHRAPECPIDENGVSLAWCGHPWDETAKPGHYDDGHPYGSDNGAHDG
jgi:hypothetical protein